MAEVWQDAIETLRHSPHVSSFGANTFDDDPSARFFMRARAAQVRAAELGLETPPN